MSDVVKFSKGGQPMFLDDFKLLQENQNDLRETLIGLLCGERNVIISGGEMVSTTTEDGGVDVSVAAGKALMGGDIVTWENELTVRFVPGSSEGVFLVLEEVEGDLRDFNDGNQQYCRVIRSVRLCTEKVGATVFIDLINEYDTKFPEVVKEVLGLNGGGATWQVLEIGSGDWYNGFSGSIKWTFINRYEITIELCISSENTDWSNDNRSVFYWRSDSIGDRELLRNDLKGRFSQAVFVDADGCPRNYVIEWANEDGYMVLHGDGDAAPTPCGSIKGRFTIDLL